MSRKSKQKPVVDHRGVTIYHAFKGRAELSYWYSLEPGQNEDSENVFDVRRLPRSYRSGLTIEDQEARKIALRRAIDHGYNFSSAARGNYGQFLRRIFTWRDPK